MARFLVKASEFKNVCKAVNDRKLAELKKEIIEILKKQDENEVKKAVDYFNSQELHYTHLEKSLVSGKWIEKAGYGVGTVRIWKGKKYKKIAPGKWARVFDKEGRGTNIAIGKLIAKVNKIDNAEDLLQFVMENKQRFIDEEGKELSIINKVRAAVDARNEKLSGESKPYVYGVGEEVSAAKNEMFSKKDKITKEEADLHKISRKYSQIPTSELKQRKAKLDRWIENKTRNKREHLNNAIFRDSYKNEVEAINKELEKRSKGTVDNKVLDKYKTDAKNMTTEQLEYYVEDLKNGTGNIGKENLEERIKIYGDELNKRKGISKPAEKYDDDKAYKEYQKLLMKENPTDADNERLGELVTEHYKHSKKEWIGGQGLKELNAAKDEDEVLSNGKTVKEVREQYGIESEKTAEKNSDRSDAMKGNKNAYKGGKIATSNPEKLKPIAKSESIEEGKVKIPYSKEIADEIKQLTNSVAEIKVSDTRYAMMNKVYYDKGNLVATDGKCMKIIKVGELSGIDNGTYVDIDNSKDGITITADKEFTKEHKFPQYERVLPQDNKEKIVLDNKALISKIKDLKKDGSISNKDSFVTFDIQGNDLMLDGVKVGDVSAANFEGEDSNYFNIDSNLLTKYLSGDYSELMSSKDNSKAMYLGNDSAINIIMPQTKYEYNYDSSGNQKREIRRKDYDSRRKDKEIADEAKSNKKAAQKMANQEYIDDVINGYKRTVPADFEEKSIKKIQDWDLGTLQNMYKIANADIDHLMETKDLQSNSFMSFTNKEFGCTPRHVIGQNYAMKEHPAIVREIERLIKEKGGKIEKSLFDDFIVDVFAADDEEEIEDELYEGETEYNDYSAEQPELFNSTSMKVREALDRIKNQVL